jgi:excisionase family DNA binding protein
MFKALSITKVSRALDVSENTTRRLIKSGRLRASRVGQKWRVFPADLEAYLGERSNRPSTWYEENLRQYAPLRSEVE